MLENATRQLFLTLLAVVAGIICCFTLEIPLGHDLKGGTQVRYELPPEVLEKLREKEGISTAEIMKQTIGVIRERIDPNGALDPNITPSGDYGILIELAYFKDPLELRRVLDRVANLGKLEFRIVADNDFIDGPVRFNMPGEKAKLDQWLKNPENKKLLLEDPRNIRRYNEDPVQGPTAFSNLAWYARKLGPHPKQEGHWDDSWTSPGYQALSQSTVKVYDDAEWNNGVIPESFREKKDPFLIELLAINMKERHFTGDQLDPAGTSAGPGRDGGLAVHYSVAAGLEGEYGDWSEKYINKASAIILNEIVRSAPVFQTRIPGRGEISGGFTKEEVEDLVKVLRTGSLRVEPEMVSKESIGPTLGQAAINKGMLSLVAGSVFVFVFMLWYYGTAGTIACLTLVLNVFLLFAAMLFMQATITLPGLGGIVLTMGMAVDANVLIYERIREELAKGKDMLRAVRAGFERAMSAILDSNITTFLVGLVLFNIGVGPVRGFAVTLMVGIVTTVFTQFFVTRLLFHYALQKNWLANYKPRTMFANLEVDFVKHIGKCVAASTIVILAGLSYAFFVVPREVMLGIDFTGGANLRMVLAQPTTADAIRARLGSDAVFGQEYPNAAVNFVGEADEVDEAGNATKFNVRLKLRDKQRSQIEQGRKEWRERKQAADKAGEAPPADYEPPYVAELRRIFEGQLVKPAFSDGMTEKHDSQANLCYAQIDVHFQKPVLLDAARAALSAGLTRPLVQPLGGGNATQVTDLHLEWTTQASTKPWQLAEVVQKQLEVAKLKDAEDKPVSLSDPFPEAQELQGRLVDDLRNAAIGSLVVAWALIVLYLRVRFHEYKYGLAAVVALIHDVLVAFIAVALFNHLGLVHAEINLAMIACFLTIIGYSVNDTIVIFDRIRENVTDNARVGKTEPFRVLINRALNQTMSRTLLTSGLTLLVVIAQFAVNWNSGSDLESFAFAMIVGMASGVYSTIYIAAPILIWLDKHHPPAKVEATAVPAATTSPQAP
ncbi:MAG TPA: protein translocase subunit SecD [Planctomycetota bacterium]